MKFSKAKVTLVCESVMTHLFADERLADLECSLHPYFNRGYYGHILTIFNRKDENAIEHPATTKSITFRIMDLQPDGFDDAGSVTVYSSSRDFDKPIAGKFTRTDRYFASNRQKQIAEYIAQGILALFYPKKQKKAVK